MNNERPTSNVLAKLGLSREAVVCMASRSVPKNSCGRRGLPASLVEAMWNDYQRVKSLEKVGVLYHRTRQGVYQIFHGRGYKLNKQSFLPVVEYRGRKYTRGKDGYLRDTIFRNRDRVGAEAFLHRRMWVDLHGPIPAGWQVSFKDGNNQNCVPGNLFCLPLPEVRLFHYRRLFGERARLTPAQRREWWKAFYRRYQAKRRAAFVAKGLRSDGRPRVRYFPPGRMNPEWVRVHETSTHRTMRRHVGVFSGKRTRFDLLYEEIRAEIESEKRIANL
jgi:hypothetical protein